MRAQTVVDVVPIFVALAQHLLGTSNFKMEPVRSIPLYFVAMP
jgi:hypothetical protein